MRGGSRALSGEKYLTKPLRGTGVFTYYGRLGGCGTPIREFSSGSRSECLTISGGALGTSGRRRRTGGCFFPFCLEPCDRGCQGVGMGSIRFLFVSANRSIWPFFVAYIGRAEAQYGSGATTFGIFFSLSPRGDGYGGDSLTNNSRRCR